MEQKQLDDFILRAGFSHGWENLESQARRMAEHAVEEIARLQALSVTNILIAVVPGEDGMGEEVYAQSVDEVVGLLTKLSEQVDALADSLKRIRLHCANASSYRLGQAVDSIAEHALSAVGR